MAEDDDISAEERIKKLQAWEKAKRKELEDKKKELEEKKKELEQLETKSKKEIEKAREKIEEEIEEIALEEKRKFEELEEARKRKEAEERSLEGAIAEEENKGRVREVPQQRGYGEVIEEILRGNPTVYDITNYNVMNQLERLAVDALKRSLTSTERSFVDLVQYHAERMKQSEFYASKDPDNYITRELKKIDQINRSIRERAEQTGDYRP
ncbi:hypothetical protein JW756_04305 [Candidatus Woesearchaeota archaeon]|nr:hypothetical protein [Candidatus Woesearchaeota archaeon]